MLGCRNSGSGYHVVPKRHTDMCAVDGVREYVKALDTLDPCDVYARFAIPMLSEDKVYHNLVLPLPANGSTMRTRWGVSADPIQEEILMQDVLQCYFQRIGKCYSVASVLNPGVYPDRDVFCFISDSAGTKQFLRGLKSYLGCIEDTTL